MRISCHLSTTEATENYLPGSSKEKLAPPKLHKTLLLKFWQNFPFTAALCMCILYTCFFTSSMENVSPEGAVWESYKQELSLVLACLLCSDFLFLYIFDGSIAAFCFHLERKCVADIFDIPVLEFSRETEAIPKDKSFCSTAPCLPPQLFHQLLSCFHV